MKLIFALTVPLILAFSYTKEIKDWEKSQQNITAHERHLRGLIMKYQYVCKKELVNRRFPENCIKLIFQADQIGIKLKDTQFLEKIERLCVHASFELTNEDQIKNLNKFSVYNLSTCQKSLDKRLSVLRYKKEL